MGATALRRTFIMLTVVATLFGLAALGGCTSPDTDDEVPIAGDAADTGAGGAGSDSTTTDGSGEGDASNAPATVTVRLYWVEAGENALGVERTLPYTQAVATAAMNALLDGPTPEERATWPAISSAIPDGTQLLGLTVADGIARVDLSSEFESGGGTFSVTARLAQVVYTLEQFPTVDAVEFSIDGVPVEMFSSEGIVIDGPQTLDDYDELLPIDA